MLFKSFIFACLQALFIPLIWAQKAPAIPLPTQTVERLMQSVVAVQSRTDDDASTVRTLGQRRQGSGVVIGPDLVLTIGYLLIEGMMKSVFTRKI